MHPSSPNVLGLAKENRRARGGDVGSGDGRRRGSVGEDRTEEALAVDNNDLDRDPAERHAMSLSLSVSL